MANVNNFDARTLNKHMNQYYVYQLVDPRTNTPFYIGEGKGKRAYSHLNFTSGCNNPHKDRIIKKIQSSGNQVVVEIIKSNLSKEQSVKLEEEIIKHIGIENLSNICLNANPPILAGSSNGFYQKTHSDETKRRLGQVNKGKDIKTKEGKESIRQSMIDRWHDPVKRQNQIDALKSRKGEKRSPKAIESYKKSAAQRNAKMTAEQRSARSLAGCETKKIKYAGLKRKSYIDEFGKKRFRWISSTD
jgi:hypothetical protein